LQGSSRRLEIKIARQNTWLLNAEEEGFEPINTILSKGVINAIYTYI